MKKVTINEIDYELVKEYRDGFELDEVSSKLTDYFNNFDYVVGDWAYGKLRLKGFYESSSRNVKPINDIKILDIYLNESCAKNCRYFVIKKII